MFKIPPLSSDILAISLDGKGSPSINLSLPDKVGGSHSHGWGFGWYPNDESSAIVTKDPTALGERVLVDAITDWKNFRSTVFFCKARGASKGYTHTQTQPFSRSYAKRDWLFMHNGDLDRVEIEKLYANKTDFLEPLGNTDSELAFCNLLSLILKHNVRTISDIDHHLLHSWFLKFDEFGSADMCLSDGDSIVCFHGTQSPKQLYYTRIQPPNNQDVYISEAAEISLNDPRDTYRTAFIVSSSPFTGEQWMQMQPGQMLVIRRGVAVWDSAPHYQQHVKTMPLGFIQAQQQQRFMAESQLEQSQSKPAKSDPSQMGNGADRLGQETVLNIRSITKTEQGTPLNYRLYEVTHETHYEYTEAVEHSTHTFRLQPTDDPIQEVEYCKLTISSPAEEIQYEDVFGNQSIHCAINQPYTKLLVRATSRVKIYAAPPDDYSVTRRQSSIRPIWMPWQRQIMMPYLLPSELPESQLTELTDYAMSFAERNDHHLLKTLEDINFSIYRDYKYVSGSTSLSTTPFNVYTSREGVCQDFANLFICLARLLSIPARYRMGYIYTGASYENKIQSEASHAWAEVYLPYVGWRGFDPTNGCAVGQDHVRVACGRNYRDSTPTSGTIYKGGGTETLTVDVKMHEIKNENE